ncbi:mannitol-specific phosphotransferase enzyme IIA component [Shouchella clausii]|jgi:mannitol PTS system EIIA component|uniref:Mannitol-specific phosphotransferase enzyme IIA component n=2 Tax=Shouchella TaxID=2893057 RepID=Q5WDU9_SHOC1|nr:PTS sugar transporter subunit IIA [Shouchella clausii]MCM3313669.1 PTS sugar transporter subunit IIA [Psychrobacillus sp. MER TA 17]MCM3547636.1 PTS sugar transporter subunit IIA [Shouchella clausii]PAD46801.1 PTS mannitol transporter subunit IIA [Shouchella clausii]PAE92056.1 PTS mannitol transporter subunit IIA [Shouchella clausii]PAF09154.1 PTS mannitol transporter subunit IIA [Shouchella clausii]
MSILKAENIKIGASVGSKEEAIKLAGQVLADQGYVNEQYIDKMFAREELTSTYMGNLLAIPHGTEDAREDVKQSGLSILLLDHEIDWNGNPVQLVIGIAGKGDEHLEILSKIAIACSEEDNVRALLQVKTAEDVLDFFSGVTE